MSSLGIDSAIRIGNPSATIKWGLTGLQFSSPNHPMNSNKPIGQNVRIGHVHLKVADLERALGFYCGILGFETTVRFGHSHSLRTCGRRWRCLANWVVSQPRQYQTEIVGSGDSKASGCSCSPWPGRVGQRLVRLVSLP